MFQQNVFKGVVQFYEDLVLITAVIVTVSVCDLSAVPWKHLLISLFHCSQKTLYSEGLDGEGNTLSSNKV